jgi:ribosomal protein S18 acetylase RimI-like enzyme
MEKCFLTDIRKAHEDDKDRLVEILRGTYLETMARIVPSEALEAFHRNDEAARFVDNCWRDFDVATVCGEVMGLLFVVGKMIESLHIHPGQSRKGYGAALLLFAEETIATNSETAELDVLVDNKNAIAFYEVHGWVKSYEHEGLEVGNVPARMYRMTKDLT